MKTDLIILGLVLFLLQVTGDPSDCPDALNKVEECLRHHGISLNEGQSIEKDKLCEGFLSCVFGTYAENCQEVQSLMKSFGTKKSLCPNSGQRSIDGWITVVFPLAVIYLTKQSI